MFAFSLFEPSGVHLAGKRVTLRPPRTTDHREWAALRMQSRSFLKPWEPQWNPGELGNDAWRLRMAQYRRESRTGTGQAFFIFDNATHKLAGGIALSGIRRGVSQSAHVGYWMGEAFAGKGLMTEALLLVEDFCFNTLRLHRIEAACIPENQRSIHVLEKVGFSREGLMKSYLRINGEWRDHLLFALIQDDFWARFETGKTD